MVKRIETDRNIRTLYPKKEKIMKKTGNFASSSTSLSTNNVILLIVVLVLLGGIVDYTYAYFREKAAMKENKFRASWIGDFVNIVPGKAKATFPAVGDPNGETRPVASYNEEGQLVLDFGEVVAGTSRNFDDVFIIHNISTEPLKIFWELNGMISELMNISEGRFLLMPEGKEVKGEVYGDINMKLRVDIEKEPGIYQGKLVVKVNGNFLSMILPCKVVVRPKAEKDLKTPKESAEDQVSSSIYEEIAIPETKEVKETDLKDAPSSNLDMPKDSPEQTELPIGTQEMPLPDSTVESSDEGSLSSPSSMELPRER